VNAQQTYKGGKVKGVQAVFKIEEFASGVAIYNEINPWKGVRTTKAPDQIPLSGVDYKMAETQIKTNIKAYLNKQKRLNLNLQAPMSISLMILPTGKIEGVTFHLPSKINYLTIQDFEAFEKIIKNIKVPIKNPSLYEGVNYIPFGIILRVATL
jgi:hypothetical protein